MKRLWRWLNAPIPIIISPGVSTVAARWALLLAEPCMLRHAWTYVAPKSASREDRYGIALMMIREGCANPDQVAVNALGDKAHKSAESDAAN